MQCMTLSPLGMPWVKFVAVPPTVLRTLSSSRGYATKRECYGKLQGWMTRIVREPKGNLLFVRFKCFMDGILVVRCVPLVQQ